MEKDHQIKKVYCPVCQQNSDFVFTKEVYKLYRCNVCMLLFVYPIPLNTSSLYGKNYFVNAQANDGFGYTDYSADKEPIKDNFINYLKFVENKIIGRRVFDVGAATGFFLDIAKQRGWDTFGIDISVYAAEQAQLKGHLVTAGQWTEISSTEKYDLVTMWDVLEHVSNPKCFIDKAYKVLNDGGVIAINTVDSTSWWARIMGKKWHLLVPPEHLFYFSYRSLHIMLNSAGFEVISVQKPCKKFTIPYIFKMLYKWQKLPLWKFLSRWASSSAFISRVYIPINLHDNILVFAQKNENHL